MFRTQENVPEIYVRESRDFQLLGRLLDITQNSVKNDINTIVNITNPFKINDRMLELMSTKVGFFAKYAYDGKILRYINAAFAYILKNKGSKRGIEEAISTILKVDGIVETPTIIIDNSIYTIKIFTGTKIYNKTALMDILSYIVPIGYTYTIEEAIRSDDSASITQTTDEVKHITQPTVKVSVIRGSEETYENEMEEKYDGSYIATTLIGEENDE